MRDAGEIRTRINFMVLNDEKATYDPMQVYITQQFESNQENNLLLTLFLYFQQIEHFKLG